jgi:hypothetical protein
MNQRALVNTTIVFFFSIFLFLLVVFNYKSLLSQLWVCFIVIYIIGLHYITIRVLFAHFLGAQRADSVLVNLMITATVTLIILIGAEFTLRFVFHDVTTTGDYTSYFSEKWKKNIHYNRWGFRERDFDPIKPNGTYRIAVIGDSLTFGQGINEKDRFSNLLEEKLNAMGGRKYQLLNFALPGAETTDELKFLTNSVLSNKPDFVLLQWYFNDVQGDDKSDVPHPVTIIPRALRRGLVLFYLAHRELSEIQSRLGLVESHEQYMSARFGNPNSPASLKAMETMNSFIEICRDAHIPVGIVLFSNSYFNRSTKLDFLLDRMLGYCKDKGLRCVDTRKVLLPMQGDPSLWASRFDAHPSAVANQLVADQIMGTFKEVWIR